MQEKAENGGMDVDGAADEEIPTYTSIEAPPSVLPQKHWCDITGLEAPYTDPTTGLRYHDKNIYALIKGMSASVAKDYLSGTFISLLAIPCMLIDYITARGVHSIVK
uniref:Vps72/YL1 C-terminal domain-containing protein n=1 Tax=Moniliophthora roreri TaxID=221103 RepID=A0A0W0EX66_MONRR